MKTINKIELESSINLAISLLTLEIMVKGLKEAKVL